MIDVIINGSAFWGFLGAFIYAGPKLSACIFETGDGTKRHSLWYCILEFVMALGVGVIAAEAFGPWVQGFLKRDGQHELRAISGLIGLLANPLSPVIVKGFEKRAGAVIKGGK